jgi:hypothetical protein
LKAGGKSTAFGKQIAFAVNGTGPAASCRFALAHSGTGWYIPFPKSLIRSEWLGDELGC